MNPAANPGKLPPKGPTEALQLSGTQVSAMSAEGLSDGAGEGVDEYSAQLELALRGMLELTVAVLERVDKKIGLGSLRALQALRRRGPCMVTELAHDLDLLVSTASRLSDRLADAELITRSVSPINRRATQLELAPAGQAVLDELVAMRAAALAEITRHMSASERHALLTGAQAFTRARGHRRPPTS
jgi:DNA-binding MarR family transcriptional regulator